MKPFLLFSLIFLIPALSFGQGISAADTLSPGIVYVDIPDEMVAAPYPDGYETFSMDVDNDGNEDLYFSSSKFSSMASTSEETSCSPIPLSSTEIVVYDPNSGWVDQLNPGELIGPESNWGNGGTLQSTLSIPGSTTTSGIFSSGYVGFKMQINDQNTYGWIHAQASSGHVKIKAYAYLDISTSTHEWQENSMNLYPNPVEEHLYLTGTFEEMSYQVSDLLGTLLLQGIFTNENNRIDCSGLAQGLYLIQVYQEKTLIQTLKFIKK